MHSNNTWKWLKMWNLENVDFLKSNINYRYWGIRTGLIKKNINIGSNHITKSNSIQILFLWIQTSKPQFTFLIILLNLFHFAERKFGGILIHSQNEFRFLAVQWTKFIQTHFVTNCILSFANRYLVCINLQQTLLFYLNWEDFPYILIS